MNKPRIYLIITGRKRIFVDFTFQHTLQVEAGEILVAYGQEIAKGAGIKGTNQPYVKIIRGYLRAFVGLSIADGLDNAHYLLRLTLFIILS